MVTIAVSVSVLTFFYSLGMGRRVEQLKEHVDFQVEVIKYLGATDKQILDHQKEQGEFLLKTAQQIVDLQKVIQ